MMISNDKKREMELLNVNSGWKKREIEILNDDKREMEVMNSCE